MPLPLALLLSLATLALGWYLRSKLRSEDWRAGHGVGHDEGHAIGYREGRGDGCEIGFALAMDHERSRRTR
jgi:hypothetical protein